MNKIETDEGRKLQSDMRVLQRGITTEALEVLERRYGFNLPLFTNDVLYSADSNDKYLRQALIKEGQRQIISFIRLSLTQNNNG